MSCCAGDGAGSSGVTSAWHSFSQRGDDELPSPALGAAGDTGTGPYVQRRSRLSNASALLQEGAGLAGPMVSASDLLPQQDLAGNSGRARPPVVQTDVESLGAAHAAQSPNGVSQTSPTTAKVLAAVSSFGNRLLRR